MHGPRDLAPTSCWLQASEHILYQTSPVINKCLYCTINSVHFNKFPVVLTQSPFSPYLTPLCQTLYNLCVCFLILLSAPSKFPLSHQVTVAFVSHINLAFSVWDSFLFTGPTLLSLAPALQSPGFLPKVICQDRVLVICGLWVFPLCVSFTQSFRCFQGLCSSFVALCWRRHTESPLVPPGHSVRSHWEAS